MNFRALFAAAAVAATATFVPVDAATYSSTACTSTQTNAAYVALVSLLLDTDLNTCSTDSGYNLLFATTLPSDAQYVKMCASTACNGLLAEVLELNPPDCVLNIPTSGLQANILALASEFDSVCASISLATNSTSA